MNESERFDETYLDDRSALALGLHLREEESLLRAFVSFLTAEGFDEDLRSLALGEKDIEEAPRGWRRHFGFILSGLAVASLLLSIHLTQGRVSPPHRPTVTAAPAVLTSLHPEECAGRRAWPNL